MKYYVRDAKGRVAGPFSVDAIKKAASEGRILPSWHISSSQDKWTLAATVPDLFPVSEKAASFEPPVGSRTGSVRESTFDLFLDTFKGGKERFKVGWPWIQRTRLWWVKLTRPSKGFLVIDVGPRATSRLRYDFETEQPAAISEAEYEKELNAGIRQLDWYLGSAFLVIVTGAIWAWSDFGASPNINLGVVKLVAVLVSLVLGYVYREKRSKVFVGYVLASEIDAKLNDLHRAFSALTRCSRVWALQLKPADQDWKYRVGRQISHLPTVNLNRPLPRIQTNISICSVAFHGTAIYFLPEKLLVIAGRDIRHIAYRDLESNQDHVDYLHTGWQRYNDSLVVGSQWLHGRKDGGPDRRFRVNYQIPIVRVGILTLGVPGVSVGLITTDPTAPGTFRQYLPRL